MYQTHRREGRRCYPGQRTLILLMLLLTGLPGWSQNEANYWYFGGKVGFDFSNGLPEALRDGAMNTQDGCAVMSDKTTGKLLFYTNGRNIWNREHALMPNGSDFPADCRSYVTQSALIVPVPGEPDLFYVFAIYYGAEFNTLDNCGGYAAFGGTPYHCEIRYSVVDMAREGGKGDVVPQRKNIVLQTNATEKLTAVPHQNGRDYWLISHEWNSNRFYVYLISGAGIASPAVVPIGSVHQVKQRGTNYRSDEIRGYLKASPNGRKLACAVSSFEERPFDLFDFDATTGSITNYVNLGGVRGQYGVSFSPDNTKLYVSTDGPPTQPYKDIIRQYDLAARTDEAIIASGKSILRDNPYTNVPDQGTFTGFSSTDIGLQIGKDGRIYAASDNAESSDSQGVLVIIGRPNQAGYDCQVNYQRFGFGGRGVGVGLPNFIQSYFNLLEPAGGTPECNLARVAPNPVKRGSNVLLRMDCDQPYTLDVINAVGQRMMAAPLHLRGNAEVPLADWSSGLYLFCITLPTMQYVVKVVIFN